MLFKKITEKGDFIGGITLIDLKQIQYVCNENGEEGMKMFNFNEEFWHLDSSCLTFFAQTALIVCGATLKRIQKIEFFLKNRAKLFVYAKSACLCAEWS